VLEPLVRIEEELKDGLQYWELEQSLCNAVSLGSQASLLNCFLSFPLNWCSGYKSLSLLFACLYQIKVEDVIQAIQLKSFDYRVLNLLMYHLQNQLVTLSKFYIILFFLFPFVSCLTMMACFFWFIWVHTFFLSSESQLSVLIYW
jgi:hypothetical protein